jgi:hypothetical protein
MSKKHSPNDHRAIVKNPNSSAHAADRANRQELGHGNIPLPPPAPSAPPEKPAKK